MARVKIENNIILSFDYSHKDKYWKDLSAFLIQKYGSGPIKEHQLVETILLDCFHYMVDKFKELVFDEKNFKFFLYVFWLHEESIKLYIKTLRGFKIHTIDETEFAIYRRVLKLILEQGCAIDLEWGEMPSGEAVLAMDEKIQRLLYLGNWMYGFAESIAFQKMVEDCHEIRFNNEGMLVVDWQYHYGEAYQQLFPKLSIDYEKGTYDEHAVKELRSAIENCFGVNYDFAFGIVNQIKRHLNPEAPTLQTIQPYVLPQNLVNIAGISQTNADLLYSGLTISRTNKMSLEEAIYKPYSMQRYMFRPILVYRIGGEDRALIGDEKFPESLMVLATNALHWNALPQEWLKVKCMQLFMNKKGHEHDKILEDKIEEVIKARNLLFCRNIKTFKQLAGNNIRIDNELAGEIDFIIVDTGNGIVYVTDTKYNRSRYEAIGYRNDYSNFVDKYEAQLKRKIDWVSGNLNILQEHLRITNDLSELDLSGFDVKGVFLINTPTFYMFNGKYKAITLNQLAGFLDGENYFPDIFLIKASGKNEEYIMARHPYFKKPLIMPDFENDEDE